MAKLNGFICDVCHNEFRPSFNVASGRSKDQLVNLTLETGRTTFDEKYGYLDFHYSNYEATEKVPIDACPKCAYTIKMALNMIFEDGPDTFLAYLGLME